MPGSFYNGICYGNNQDAIDTYYQDNPPTFFRDLSNDISFSYTRDGSGIWHLTKSSIDSSGAITPLYNTVLTAPVFGSCDLPNDPTSSFESGMELGAAVAGVVVVTYVIRRMYRG